MIAFITILVAAGIQGITGFGFSLVSLPLLAMLLPMETIVPMLVLYSLCLNIVLYKKVKGQIEKKRIVILVTCGLLFIPVGIYGLTAVNESLIKIIVGAIIIISSLALGLGFKIKFKNPMISYGLSGILSGLLNGASSLSGPPVILLLSNEGVDKDNFRKTLATYFMVLNLFSIPMFVMSGVLTTEVLLETLKYSPAMVVGVLGGVYLGNFMPEKLFRGMTLVLIFVMGIMTIVSSV